MLCFPAILAPDRGRGMNFNLGRSLRAGGLAVLATALLAVTAATAQQAAPAGPPPSTVRPLLTPREGPAADVSSADPLSVPSFWDPRHRPERPDLSRITIIRFLTETDYPPFDYAGPDGAPAGFNVDLARLLCEEIKVTCTVQMRRFETLLDAISSNRGDAIIASLAVTPELRKRVDFTDPYYRAPA